MRFGRFSASLPFWLLLCASPALSQSAAAPSEPDALQRVSSCDEAPREDALAALCAPPSSTEEAGAAEAEPVAPASIPLTLPGGTPLRIAVDQRVRISHSGEAVHGKVVEAVYAFDQEVIPKGSVATGHVKRVTPPSGFRRAMAYSNGDFSPFRRYEVTFDMVTLPDGRQMLVTTTVTPGTAEVVHLVSNPAKQKGVAGRTEDKARAEAKGRIQEAKQQAREWRQKLTAPGRMQRLKEFLVSQLPYRRQYMQPGTRFVAELRTPLEFGSTARTSQQLAALGSEPAADSTLKARLVAEVSSATATRGTPVTAMLTEPVYSATHQLILPANSRLVGEVVKAQRARKLHRNGELRVIFERIETSEEALRAQAQLQMQAGAEAQRSQTMVGNLEGVEVDKRANMHLDEEGGAHTTTSKTRYLSSGLAVMLAAAASHTEVEHGTTEMAGPGVRTAAGGSGFRITGALLSLAAKSTPVSVALGAYGASTSIYANFISRGRDVILPKDTPLEIGFGPPHAKAQ
ncbi:MAG TPA: hypothetical protein VKQ28_02100 [Candidatus Acidoferrum sp.]|nr:hypothetical protein [Candidatus Acidoferrum sp.]